jgi:hypothetical protein
MALHFAGSADVSSAPSAKRDINNFERMIPFAPIGALRTGTSAFPAYVSTVADATMPGGDGADPGLERPG